MNNLFNNDDYLSADGMLTSVWGPSMWHFLHTMSFNYPVNPTKDQKKDYYNYLISLQKVLPCLYCRDNYPKNLKKAKFSRRVLRNRDTFSKFMYNLHEEVNCMLGKSSNLTYAEVRNRYEHFRSRCLNDGKKSKKTLKKIQGSKNGGVVLEKGCVDSLYGKKSKCVLQIVPKESKIKSFRMSPKCKIKRLDDYCKY